MARTLAVASLCLVAAGAHVQAAERTRAASEIPAATAEMRARAYARPAIRPDAELKGAALLQALREGGHVLYLRHTQTGTVTETCGPSNLTPAGERDARFIGEAIRALRIPIDRVLSSPVCRVLDSAKLLQLGEVTTTRDLSNVAVGDKFDLAAARAARLAEVPAKGANRMLVSHLHAGAAQEHWISLDFGDIIVFRPDGNGGSEARARIRADDWYDLLELNAREGGRQ